MHEEYDREFEPGEEDIEWVKKEGQWRKSSLLYMYPSAVHTLRRALKGTTQPL